MEFSGEMNIYRESELSGDFEGEIRKEKSARKESGGLWRIRNQSPPAGNSPRTGTSLIEMDSWSGGFLGILGLEEKRPSLTPHPRV
ncbi:hypothetical protein CK203_028490 [Vitis vinifera]|uniref:Uncharacterized protein n=1 Tax=Vitis vinifera TaxID=29760 RepID=A0A438I292_VITVI|nr:hypothetical protein CK203_028490 [Vitis vinifera]